MEVTRASAMLAESWAIIGLVDTGQYRGIRSNHNSMDLHFKKHNKYFFWNLNQLIKEKVMSLKCELLLLIALLKKKGNRRKIRAEQRN